MAGLQCVCGDVFRASCDVEPASCAVAWLLVLLSAIVHVWRCCALEDDATDTESDDEPTTMYS